MGNEIIYSGLFVNDKDDLKKRFKPLHKNEFYHHSTIEFTPYSIDNNLIGKVIDLEILGRFSNDKVDVLLVSNPFSVKAYPHITLSTAEGVNANQSDLELEKNPSGIRYFRKLIRKRKPKIETTYGYFSPKGVIKKKKLWTHLLNTTQA